MDLQYLLGVQRKALQHKARRSYHLAMSLAFHRPTSALFSVVQDSELEVLARRLVSALVDSGVPRDVALAAAQRGAGGPLPGDDAPARPLDAVTTELTDVVADLQRQLQEAQDAARRHGAERSSLADAIQRRDAEIDRLSSQQGLAVQHSLQPSATATSADADSAARVIQQLHDQACAKCSWRPFLPPHPSDTAPRLPCRSTSSLLNCCAVTPGWHHAVVNPYTDEQRRRAALAEVAAMRYQKLRPLSWRLPGSLPSCEQHWGRSNEPRTPRQPSRPR